MARLALVVAALALVLGLSAPADAQRVIYRWVDAKGVVHFTDDLNKVPEPYASMYQARIREIERKRAEEVGDRKEPPPQPSTTQRPTRKIRKPAAADVAERERAKWQKRVAQWRQRLDKASEELERLEQQEGQLNVNPLLRVTPHVKAQIAEVAKQRAAALKRVEAAKKMLLETIPAEAKKAGVPYKWLL